MHCGVMVTGYNQGDWERLLAEDYSRPPAVSDAANMDDTLALGDSSSLSGSTPSGPPSTTAPPIPCSRIRFSTWRTGRDARVGSMWERR